MTEEDETGEDGAVGVASQVRHEVLKGGALSYVQEFGQAVADDTGAMLKYPHGAVVGILKRNWKAAGHCGSIKSPASSKAPGHTSRVVFKPMDRRFPPILIKTVQVEELLGKRIVVSMDEWQIDSRLPMGHYVRKIGDIGDKDTETVSPLLWESV